MLVALPLKDLVNAAQTCRLTRESALRSNRIRRGHVAYVARYDLGPHTAPDYENMICSSPFNQHIDFDKSTNNPQLTAAFHTTSLATLHTLPSFPTSTLDSPASFAGLSTPMKIPDVPGVSAKFASSIMSGSCTTALSSPHSEHCVGIRSQASRFGTKHQNYGDVWR